MMSLVIEGGVAIATLNLPPVNAIDEEGIVRLVRQFIEQQK